MQEYNEYDEYRKRVNKLHEEGYIYPSCPKPSKTPEEKIKHMESWKRGVVEGEERVRKQKELDAIRDSECRDLWIKLSIGAFIGFFAMSAIATLIGVINNLY